MARGKKGPIHPSRSTKEDGQIGARIRALRMDRGMSQSDLATILGLSFQQIQKYEKGVNRVSAVRLNQIAKTLDTSLNELTGFNGGPQISGIEFDIESYKLAKAFARLPAHIKPRIRSLINAIIEPEPE